MTKRFIIIALVLVLVCGALFMSCKQDPVKDNKAIGLWEAKIDEEDNIVVKVKVDADKTFTGTITFDGLKVAEFSGTWDASSLTDGTITIKSVKPEEYAKDLPIGESSNFVVNGDNLIIYEKDDPEAAVMSRVAPN